MINVYCNSGGTVSLASLMQSQEMAPPMFSQIASLYFNSHKIAFFSQLSIDSVIHCSERNTIRCRPGLI